MRIQTQLPLSWPVCILLPLVGMITFAEEPPAPGDASREELPCFDPSALPYRSLRSGEGFRTEIFGQSVTVDARDRRAVAAWDVGLTTIAARVTENEILPFASLYFWHHPDENSLFRGVVVGLYNELLYTRSTDELGPWEGVVTLENLSLPFSRAQFVDGERIDEEELVWGDLHLGLGVGYRRPISSPGHEKNIYNENMFAVSLLAEPGLLYSKQGNDTADDFVTPEDTFEMRGRLRMRLDRVERNLLELAHEGCAAGSDLVFAQRSEWDDWGIREREKDSDGRNYVSFSGYLMSAGGLPLVESERHRILWTLHGGTGDNLDRFSRHLVGGGPSGHGEEYGALRRPVLPGAFIEEFSTNHYAILVGEYRWEPIFFIYTGLRASVSYVERQRLRDGRVRKSDDALASVGARVTSGFLLDTRIQLEYNYNAAVIRDDNYGGHEVTVHISGEF